jgi:hypothetical protein
MFIKRENFGMTVTLTLLGLGVGFLVGSYVASRKEEKEQEQEEPQPVQDDERDQETIDDEKFIDAVLSGRKVPMGQERRKNKKLYDPAALHDLQQRYVLTQTQIQLVRQGLVTIEALEETLAQAEFNKNKVAYDKPDLDDLYVEAFGEDDEDDIPVDPIDLNGFRVLVRKPERRLYNIQKSLVYDPILETVYRLLHGSLVALPHVDIDHEVLQRAGTLFGNVDTVYILNEDTRILYSIVEEGEVSYEDEYEEDVPERLDEDVRRDLGD